MRSLPPAKAGPRREAAREVEEALRSEGLSRRAEEELRSAVRELGERTSRPRRRLSRVLPFLPAEARDHALAAIGHLKRAGIR